MPTTVTKTIGAGKDYTTLAAWESATDGNLVTANEVRVGLIDASENFNESITIAGATTDATRYRKLTVSDGNWHEGASAASTKARMEGNPTGRQITVDENHFWLDRLFINHIVEPGLSDEAVRILANRTGTLITRCVLKGHAGGGTNSRDCDAVYVVAPTGGTSVTVTVSNSIMFNWGRCGIYPEGNTGNGTVNARVDHVTGWRCGHNTGTSGLGALIGTDRRSANLTVNWHVYNTVSVDCPSPQKDFAAELNAAGTVTYTGSHNASSDTSQPAAWTSKQQSLVSTTVMVNPTSWNFNPVAGQALENNGVNRQGSEPDARQSFATDVGGVPRATTGVEIGAYTIASVGIALKYWTGAAWVLKPMKYWNGSAWVSANLKRWNGSSWI